jgi:hypothetical protein
VEFSEPFGLCRIDNNGAIALRGMRERDGGEFRIPRLGAPGQCHDFYSCECGFVTSRRHAESHALQMAEREIGKIRLRLDKEFLKWARLANKVTAPPVPNKLID